MDESRKVAYTKFTKRLEDEMGKVQKECKLITRFFQEPRHVEDIGGGLENGENEPPNWKKHGKDRMKTVSVAIVMCLHIGIDPPDTPPKPENCAKKLAWIDPFKCGPLKAANEVALSLQKSYERWQPRAKYKVACDPPLDDVRKIATNLRRVSGGDRILFHYNGMGVPKPTENGEIWVFNKSFTQYIPLSIYDLQTWLEFPAVYVWECHSAETIVKSFQRFAEDHEKHWQNVFDKWQEEKTGLPAISSLMDQAEQAEAMGFTERYPKFHECIHLAACRAGEYLPMSDPNLPADLFTSCLTTPVHTAILWYLIKNKRLSQFPENILEIIPGSLNERRTVLGELNWIFTAITDTIAFTSIDREVFQRLFRQDLLLASLFRSFLLAQRIMSDYDVLPVSWPRLVNTSNHELWSSWDSTLDMVLDYVRERLFVNAHNVVASGREILLRSDVFPYLTMIDFSAYLNVNDNSSNSFFIEQLRAFELWLDYGIDRGTPPLQLPVVLQVLLSQTHRVRALQLLARFLDFGQWAVGYSLSVGIFPYVLRLLQSNTRELREFLAFIWAKILAVDPSCQTELFKENGEEGGSLANQPKGSTPITNMFSIERPLNHPQIGGRYQTNGNQMQERAQQYAKQMITVRSAMRQPGQPMKKPQAPLRYLYFVQILNDPDTTPREKIVPAFVLAMLTHNNYKQAQENLTEKGFVNLCTELLCDPEASKCRLLKLWLLIGLGRLWSDYDDARWQAIRLVSYDQVIRELEDDTPEVRAAAVFALGSLLKNASQTNEHASAIDEELADELCNRCVFDGSVLVREELIVALQWFIFDFEKRFVKLARELSRICHFTIPQKIETPEDEEGVDVASTMVATKGKNDSSDYFSRQMPRKKMSTSMFNEPFTEDVVTDMFGRIRSIKHEFGRIEREPEDVEYRTRALLQIKHLEGKTFNEPIARTWLALMRLSLDPVEHVARMAQKIVKRVETGTHNMEVAINQMKERQVTKNLHRKVSQIDMHRKLLDMDRKISEVSRKDSVPTKKTAMSYEKSEKAGRVPFQIGSPSDNQEFQTANNVLSPVSSPSAVSEQDKFPDTSKRPVLFYQESDSLDEAEFADAIAKSFTPKRRTNRYLKRDDFSKKEDSRTLRDVINNPIVSTQFVPWCSRIFVEPILHLLKEDPNQNDVVDGTVMTKTSLSDWAIHAMEGIKQSADIEGAAYKTTKYDHCLWKVNLTHSISTLVTSKLRRCMYASDGRMLTIIRQDSEPRLFRKFNLTYNNPFNQDHVSQLLLINETSREMVVACSRTGVIRIWDPCFTAWSDDYEKPAQMISAAFPLGEQMKLSDESARCIFDWSQSTGRVLCTGSKSVHVWDAHYEKNVMEIPYPSVMPSSQPTAMSGDLDEEGKLLALGYSDGQIDVFDLRFPRLRAMRMPAVTSSANNLSLYDKNASSIMHLQMRMKNSQNYLFAGNRDGVITQWEPRNYQVHTQMIETEWTNGSHESMYVHENARMLASASESTVMIYDIASGKRMAKVLPPQTALDFERSSKGTFSFLRPDWVDGQKKSPSNVSMRIPKVTALTMHQMRLMTVVGYDDNSVCVYGALKPGLTAVYESMD